MSHRVPTGLAAVALLLATPACEGPGSPAGPATASPWSALGEDGALTVSAQNTVLNAYSALAADASAGTTALVITSAGQLDLPPPMGPAGPGDLVLVIQMQGAAIDTSNSPSFGAVTDFASAGRYELAVLGAVSGTSLQLALGCGGLRHDYSAAGGGQVVRVPMLESLTVDGFGSVVAAPWDGARGGVAALHVLGALVVDGAIHATGAGFRGGEVDTTTTGAALDNTTWRSTDPGDGAEKGESIAGFAAEYDSAGGRYGRAAPANGGGGGTAHNGGGGGGANASNSLPWTGQGVMDAGTTGAAAWTLDPAYAANGNSLSNSAGGGRGGYSFSAADQDALVDAPGTASWGGNSRRERGGLGGRPFGDPVNERLYLGGGGGAGDTNNGAGGAGGRGGGLVFLVAASVDGTGAIRADGLDGDNTIPSHNDAPGGGGAGGTIVIESRAIGGVYLSADGGNGGVQLINTNEGEGPGGGGGGGRIAIPTGVPTRSALGGANGTTTSLSLTEFPANGATRGALGFEDDSFVLGDLPGCRPIDLSVTKDDSRDSVRRGARTTYVIEVSLVSDAAGVTGIVVQDPLPAGVASSTWTCEATTGSSCADATGTGAIDTTVDLAPGGVATFVVDARLERDAPDTLENTVTVTAPGYADADPTNDIAVDVDDVRQEYGVAGSGCGCRTTAPGHPNGALLLLAAAALACGVRRFTFQIHASVHRGRRPGSGFSFLVIAAGVVFAARSADAGDAVDIQQFKPAPGSEDALAVQSARPGPPGTWHSFAAIHYANQPFRLVDRATGRTAGTIVGHQTAFDLGGSWAWNERYEIGAVIPVTLNQTAGNANDLDPRVPSRVPAQGFGDLRLVPKARILERGSWTAGVSAPLSLPTGGDGFLGRTGPTLRPRVLASWGQGRRTELMGMGGLVLRSSEKVLNFDQGLSLELGAGAVRPFALQGRRFAAVATLAGEVGLPDRGAEERPLELLAGLRWISARGTAVTLGAGPGLTHGAGTPEYRLLLSVSQGSARPTRPLPPPDDSVHVDRATLKLVTDPVYFGTDNDLIEPRSFPVLLELARFLRDNAWIRKVRIEGHTDAEGGEQYNLNLSQLRTISIARFLVKNGVDPDSLDSKGFGLTRPVDTNDTEEGRARNRRVDFVILEIDEEIAPAWAKAAFSPVPTPTPAP